MRTFRDFMNEKKTTYNTLQDAQTAWDNSGVVNFVTDDDTEEKVVRKMYREDMSPEDAVADVLDLDSSDRRAIGAKRKSMNEGNELSKMI